MKNIKVFIVFSFACLTNVFGQVGINTTDPQEALHIAGSDSNIRVEGLNNANNANNLGGVNNYNLMVDTNGDLSLGLQSGLLRSVTKLPSPVAVQSTATAGLNSAELYQENFTLSQRALVVITYNVAIEFKSYDGTTKLKDGRAKIAHNYFYIGNGTTADTSKAYGMASNVYSNYIDDAAINSVYNSHSEIISLEPGTYSIHMQGAVFGGGLTSDASFRGIFGNGDRLDISVIYL
jgi:hypothetical protein